MSLTNFMPSLFTIIVMMNFNSLVMSINLNHYTYPPPCIHQVYFSTIGYHFHTFLPESFPDVCNHFFSVIVTATPPMEETFSTRSSPRREGNKSLRCKKIKHARSSQVNSVRRLRDFKACKAVGRTTLNGRRIGSMAGSYLTGSTTPSQLRSIMSIM